MADIDLNNRIHQTFSQMNEIYANKPIVVHL